MSADARAMLSEIAPRPTRQLDTAWIQRRGDRIRMARRVLAVALALPLLGGLAWGANRIPWGRDAASVGPAGHLEMVADSPCEAPNADVTFYLKDGASLTAVSDLEFEIITDPHVVDVVYVDKHDAWAEYKTVYRDHPQLWRHLPVDALPASLRVGVDASYHVDAVVHSIATPSVVYEVSTNKSANPCEKLERARRNRLRRQRLQAQLAALRAEIRQLGPHDAKHVGAARAQLEERARDIRRVLRRLDGR